MKQLILNLSFLLLPLLCMGQSEDVTGRWYTENNAGIVEVYIENGVCNGKLISLAEPNDANGQPLKDVKNKEKSLRSRPLVGVFILKDLKLVDNVWKGGKVYDPESGNTYNCTIKKEGGLLHVRGSIGPFGKTTKWKPAPAK